MTKNLRRCALLIAMLLTSTPRTEAAIITYNQTVDLTTPGLIQPGIAGEFINTLFTAAPDYLINPGDTLVINYSFLPGQRLQLANTQGDPDEFVAGWVFQSSGCHTFSGTGSASFLSATGTGTMVPHGESNGCAHVGLMYNAGNATLTLSPANVVEFSGMSFSMLVQTTSAPNLLLDGPWLYLSADDLTVITTAPEPATILLMGPALMGLAVRRWRGRHRAKA